MIQFHAKEPHALQHTLPETQALTKGHFKKQTYRKIHGQFFHAAMHYFHGKFSFPFHRHHDKVGTANDVLKGKRKCHRTPASLSILTYLPNRQFGED